MEPSLMIHAAVLLVKLNQHCISMYFIKHETIFLWTSPVDFRLVYIFCGHWRSTGTLGCHWRNSCVPWNPGWKTVVITSQ